MLRLNAAVLIALGLSLILAACGKTGTAAKQAPEPQAPKPPAAVKATPAQRGDFYNQALGLSPEQEQDAPAYSIASESKTGAVWSARVLVKDPELSEAHAKAVAAKVLREMQPQFQGLNFSVLGVKATDVPGLFTYPKVYRVKAATTDQAALAMGRGGAKMPFVEFTVETH